MHSFSTNQAHAADEAHVHSNERCTPSFTRCLPTLNSDCITEILRRLDDISPITATSTAREYTAMLRTSQEYTTLHTAIPRVSHRFKRLYDTIRPDHIKIESSLQLHRFTNKWLGSNALRSLTRLEIRLDTRGALLSLAALLKECPRLEVLALRQYSREPLRPDLNASPVQRRIPPILVDAIGQLPVLRVLAILSGETLVCRSDLHRIGTCARSILYLHIPSILFPQELSLTHPDEDTVHFPLLRTLSVGYPERNDPTNVFHEILRNGTFPFLDRLNVLGTCLGDVKDSVRTLGMVRSIETFTSNIKIWEALHHFHQSAHDLPLLETLELHIDRTSPSFGPGLPHLRIISLVDDRHTDGSSRRLRLESVLRAIVAWKSGCPKLDTVCLSLLGDIDGLENLLEHYTYILQTVAVVFSHKVVHTFST